MESKDSRKNQREKVYFPPPGPGKKHGKVSIGFTSFKLINSKIKLVKQVDVKNAVIRAKAASEASSSRRFAADVTSGTSQTGKDEKSNRNDEPSSKNLNMAELKKMRERFQAKKKLQTLSSSELICDTTLLNGVHPESTETSKTENTNVVKNSMRHNQPTRRSKSPTDSIEAVKNASKHCTETQVTEKSNEILSDGNKQKKKHRDRSHQKSRVNHDSSPENCDSYNISVKSKKNSPNKDNEMMKTSDTKRSRFDSTSSPDHNERLDRNHEKSMPDEKFDATRKSRSKLIEDQSRSEDHRSDSSYRKSKRSSVGSPAYSKSSVYAKKEGPVSNSSKPVSGARSDKKRSNDKIEANSKYSAQSSRSSSQKHSDSRKHKDRSNSRSPYREKDYRYYDKEFHHSSKKGSARDRSKSPYRVSDKEMNLAKDSTSDDYSRTHRHDREYSSHKSHSASRSRHKGNTYARKYSASAAIRDESPRTSYSKSSGSYGHHGDSRSKYHEREQETPRSRSSNYQKHEKDAISKKYSRKSSTDHKTISERKERDRYGAFSSPKSSSHRNSMEKINSSHSKKEERSGRKKKRTKVDEGLFSKISIACSLDGEDEDYEVEMSGSDDASSKSVEEESSSQQLLAERSLQEDTIAQWEDESSMHSKSPTLSPNNELLSSLDEDRKARRSEEDERKMDSDDDDDDDDRTSHCMESDYITVDDESDGANNQMQIVDEVKADSSEYDCKKINEDKTNHEIDDVHQNTLAENEIPTKFELKAIVNNDETNLPTSSPYEQSPKQTVTTASPTDNDDYMSEMKMQCESHVKHCEVPTTPNELNFTESQGYSNYNPEISTPPTPLMDEPPENMIYMSQGTDINDFSGNRSPIVEESLQNCERTSVGEICSNSQKEELVVDRSVENFKYGLDWDADSQPIPVSSPSAVNSHKNLSPPTTSENKMETNVKVESVALAGESPIKQGEHRNFPDKYNPTVKTEEIPSSRLFEEHSCPSDNTMKETDLPPHLHKIPRITSQLQSVLKSLLQTDFKADDADKSLQLPIPNGVILKNETKSDDLSHCEDRKTETVDSISKELQSSSISHIQGESVSPKKTIGEDVLERKSISDQDEVKTGASGGISYTSLTITHSNAEKSLKASPHRLKLHATTKTPLPAKKSYVQQVQSDSESPQVIPFESDVFASATPVSSQDSSSSSNLVGTLTAEATLDRSSSHCEENSDVSKPVDISQHDLNLTRQDSSGSSANDNEEGPRRSARIRTKKTERTLKKQTSYDNIQNQDNPSTTSNDVTPTQVQSSSCGVVPMESYSERSLKDLTEEEIFKTKIFLATGIEDCPEKFSILDENLYLTSVKKSRARKEIRRMVCDCGLEETSDSDGPCGENCLNRLLMIECSSRCHFGDKCTNKRFQMRKYAPTEVFKTDFKGWGIRAAEDIKSGELVMEYCGEVVDQREFTRRSLEYSKSNHAHFYFMALSQDEVIDATYKGNASRFINHSCDPNAETQKWTVNGRLRVGFFTVKPIKKGEEITFDYQFERYGKIAQKCFCGTAKCRGYLGKAPDESDENDTKFSRLLSTDAFLDNDTSDSPEKAQKKKKLSLFQDNTMEKDISKLRGGLRSTKEVLALSRLMVRCDTHSQRSMCLHVLKDTTCQTRLKTFLQFHGLSIIWSWMVDITGIDNADVATLKMEIIRTLCSLPINNKNVIEDSKVLSVVQRWAKPEEDEKPSTDEVPAQTDQTKQCQDVTVDSETSKTEETTTAVISSSDSALAGDEANSTETSLKDDKNQETEGAKASENVIEAAAKLLDSWKDLKEIYRIPKRQKPLPSPSQDSNSRDNSTSRTSSPIPKHHKTEDIENRSQRLGSTLWRDGSLERWRDGHDKASDSKYKERQDNQFSPGSSTSSENRKEPSRRRRRFSTDSDDGSKDGNVPWHCKPPRTAKVSRQEHRRRFERGVEKREQEKRRMEEQMEAEMAHNVMLNCQQQFIGNMVDEFSSVMGPDISMMQQQPSLMGQDLAMMPHALGGNTTFTPTGASGNLIQINPAQPTQVMVDQYGQQVGVVPSIMQQGPFPGQVSIQQSFNAQQGLVQGMFNQDMNMQPGYHNSYGLTAPSMQNMAQINSIGHQQIMGNPVNIVQPNQVLPMEVQQPTSSQQSQSQPQQQPQMSNNVTILGTQNGQAIVMLTPEQLQKLTQGNLPSTSNDSESKEGKKAKDTKKESKKDQIPKQLPPNWKTATDADGRVYYYHNITRETQWDPPKWEDEGQSGKKEGDLTPTHDERRLKSKDKEDKITDEGKKARDQFRRKMSQFVIQCLSTFRKPDRKTGRITSTEDFKHLARKLTHIIMQKELKQVQVWEDLDFNANVKHKTKEYVKKYMSKVGPVYRIKDDT